MATAQLGGGVHRYDLGVGKFTYTHTYVVGFPLAPAEHLPTSTSSVRLPRHPFIKIK